jgi:hypothetical protein
LTDTTCPRIDAPARPPDAPAGVMVVAPEFCVVVVEGCPKSLKR